jgi:hypothetical protein
MRDYYQIFGISSTATLEEIRARYRFLAQAYHPDKFSSKEHKVQGEAEFKLINEAYETLIDPQQRRAYDSVRAESHGPRPSPPPPTAHAASRPFAPENDSPPDVMEFCVFEKCPKCGLNIDLGKCPKCDGPGILTRPMSGCLAGVLLLAVIGAILIFLHTAGGL